MGVGRAIGHGFATARDAIARGLVRIGTAPNHLTIAGAVFTIAAGVFLAMGAGDRLHARGPWNGFLSDHNPGYIGLSGWNLWAATMLILAAATDMLDGAVARIGGKASAFGAFLDSSLDRVSDFAIFAGIGLYYASYGNVTYTLLAMLSFLHAFEISYTRARAEDLIERCRVGYWQRGERCAAVIIALFAYNVPALLWQQAVSPAFTVWRRIIYTRQVTNGKTPVEDPRAAGWRYKICLWRWPRMTWQYDLMTGLNIAWLIAAPIPQIDVISRLVGG